MNAIAAYIGANLRRLFNDRSNVFFLILLPLLIVFALGSAFGQAGGELLVGAVEDDDTPAALDIRAAIDDLPDVSIRLYDSVGDVRGAVARGAVDGGWSLGAGDEPLTWYTGPQPSSIGLRIAAEGALRELSVQDRAARTVVTLTGVSRAAAVDQLAQPSGVPASMVISDQSVAEPFDDPQTIQAVLAGGELTLFIFLTALIGAQTLLASRQYGVTRRSRVAPITAGQIVMGEAVSRFLIGLLQAVIIIGGTAVLFQVDWRSPLAVFALSAAMALVGSGAAMVLGVLGRTEQQVTSIALAAGLILAALGGSMQPLEFFSDGMRRVALAVTPHAWMNDALWDVLVDGKGLGAVLPAVGVLVAIGLALLALASRLMLRTLR